MQVGGRIFNSTATKWNVRSLVPKGKYTQCKLAWLIAPKSFIQASYAGCIRVFNQHRNKKFKLTFRF